jgi:hypothetical protein
VVVGNYGKGGPGNEEPMLRVALSKHWRAVKAQPIRPDPTLAEVAALLEPYGLHDCVTLGRAVNLAQFGERHDVLLADAEVTDPEMSALVDDMLTPFSHGTIEIPHEKSMRDDILKVKKDRHGVSNMTGFVRLLAVACVNAPDFPEEIGPMLDPIYEDHMAQLDASSEDGVNLAAERFL